MYKTYCATVIGVNKKNNQDAHSIYESSKYLISVVADGLGSSKLSEIGSYQATRAVKKAITQWRSLKNSKTNILLKLVHFYWNLFINDLNLDKKNCLTTCLFVYIDKKNNKALLCQLGDGIIVFNSVDKVYVTPKSIDFNYTQALGSTKNISDWNITSIDFNSQNIEFFIATDGISDDIVENKEIDFMRYLIDSMNKIKKNNRNQFLKNILRDWPTKFHKDDKTICITWRKK
jgi:serine/threonine protein phosphatase PrpC